MVGVEDPNFNGFLNCLAKTLLLTASKNVQTEFWIKLDAVIYFYDQEFGQATLYTPYIEAHTK
jgi:hypothetical protein